MADFEEVRLPEARTYAAEHPRGRLVRSLIPTSAPAMPASSSLTKAWLGGLPLAAWCFSYSLIAAKAAAPALQPGRFKAELQDLTAMPDW